MLGGVFSSTGSLLHPTKESDERIQNMRKKQIDFLIIQSHPMHKFIDNLLYNIIYKLSMIGIGVAIRSKQSVWSMANFYLQLSPELTQIPSFIVNEDSETAKEKNYIRIKGGLSTMNITLGGIP